MPSNPVSKELLSFHFNSSQVVQEAEACRSEFEGGHGNTEKSCLKTITKMYSIGGGDLGGSDRCIFVSLRPTWSVY